MVPLLTLLPLPVPRHHLQPRRCRSEVQLAQLFPSTEGGWLRNCTRDRDKILG